MVEKQESKCPNAEFSFVCDMFEATEEECPANL